MLPLPVEWDRKGEGNRAPDPTLEAVLTGFPSQSFMQRVDFDLGDLGSGVWGTYISLTDSLAFADLSLLFRIFFLK